MPNELKIITGLVATSIHQDWLHMKDPIAKAISKAEHASGIAFPANVPTVCSPLRMPPYKVKVVIVGNAPYRHADGVGLAFDMPRTRDTKGTPMQHIIRTLTKQKLEFTGDRREHKTLLGHWTHQGVMLLNRTFTSPVSTRESHEFFWDPVTEQIINTLNQQPFIVWCFWGTKTHPLIPLINPKHPVIKAASPMRPDDFHYSFKFSDVNDYLVSRGQTPLTW